MLAVVDDRRGLEDADREILDRIPERLPRVLVHNKIDLTGSAPGEAESRAGYRIRLSAKIGAGVDRLCARLKTLAGYEPRAEGIFMARRRHIAALDNALASLDAARRTADEGAGVELVAEELRLAQRALGEITGEFTTDDLLGRIFATFCIGK